MTNVLRWVGSTCLGVSLLLAPGPAVAQDKPAAGKDDARRFFKAGQKAFAAGRFEEAARAFEEAFRIAPHPAPLINAGDAYEKAGQIAQAARAYQRVLDLAESGEQDRQDATDRLARLSPKLAVVQLSGDAEARVRIDEDEYRGNQRVYVDPGEHDVVLLDVDGAQPKRVEIAAGASRTITVESLQPRKSDAGASSAGAATGSGTDGEGVGDTGPTKSGGIRAPTLIAYGVAAVAAGGAVYFGLQVNDAESSYNESPNRDDLDRFNQNKLFTNIGIGVAVVGAGVGTYLLIKDLGRKVPVEEPAADAARARRLPIQVGAAPLAGGGLLVGQGRF